MSPHVPQNPVFQDDTAARKALEAIRWPNGPVCPHCTASGSAITEIIGTKRSHRAGLYGCKSCRKQFTVTVGTALERTRVPLGRWMRALHEWSTNSPKAPLLVEVQEATGVTYKTTWGMWQIIRAAAKQYRGQLHPFGAHIRPLMDKRTKAQKRGLYQWQAKRLYATGEHPALYTIRAEGVLSSLHLSQTRAAKKAQVALDRTEALTRLLLSTAAEVAKPAKKRRKRRAVSTKPSGISNKRN